MNKLKEVDEVTEPDLIDRIADALPSEVRSAYYREMRHCQSLPKNDEMLRILRAMQFLTLITVQVPGKVAIEREKLARVFIDVLKTIQESHQSSQTYHKQLDDRLTCLPASIADGISPAAIVSNINESLKQEFLLSTIPQTGEALRLVGEQMKSSADQFVITANQLTHSYSGIAESAKQAIASMEGAINSATNVTKQAAQNLSRTFRMQYRWALCVLSGLAFLLGFGLGMLLQHWIEEPPTQKVFIYREDTTAPIPQRGP